MTATTEKLMNELVTLPASERAEVAHYLLHSLDGETDSDAEAAWDAELARRADLIRSGRATGEPAEQVLAELRERFA